ncbi:sensor histidine kinase [Pelomicrobium methylotrophicum]|uniref:Sensor histidine kinase n=1 Tax=Pelomicrobium methylotrophicum TaxID=2602750 RepID=A0A5C7EUQ5_9PROT|nr:histidine kinase [Pelomicrobium methylotrophicum]TXF10806.1 sensor histidine kinase [Pelomicrobium methylotrophicum]
MPSINQNPGAASLPDFRNLGVIARVLVSVELLGFGVALARAPRLADAGSEFVVMSAVLQPALILVIVLLYAFQPWLKRLPYAAGAVSVGALALVGVTLVHVAASEILESLAANAIERHWLFALVASAMLLFYFDLRSRALSPALAEARLQALQARIHPHFLFNSLNAVLGMIRSDPRRAEAALEDLAELFRALMADNRKLSTLEREVELCRQYLQIEQLRLGPRLRVEWHTEQMPAEALVPPLTLQPLVENAVYHGIEPAKQPGTIEIRIYRQNNQVHAVLRNPYQPGSGHHSGNRMALSNIRERLALHFDAEATLSTREAEGVYEVHIVLPYRQGPQHEQR